MQDGANEDFYWILSAYGISCFIYVFGEAFKIVIFDQAHTCVIQSADILMDLPLLIMRLKVKVVSPMAKITWNYKDCILIIEVFDQFLSQGICLLGTYRPNDDGYDLEVIS